MKQIRDREVILNSIEQTIYDVFRLLLDDGMSRVEAAQFLASAFPARSSISAIMTRSDFFNFLVEVDPERTEVAAAVVRY